MGVPYSAYHWYSVRCSLNVMKKGGLLASSLLIMKYSAETFNRTPPRRRLIDLIRKNNPMRNQCCCRLPGLSIHSCIKGSRELLWAILSTRYSHIHKHAHHVLWFDAVFGKFACLRMQIDLFIHELISRMQQLHPNYARKKEFLFLNKSGLQSLGILNIHGRNVAVELLLRTLKWEGLEAKL